MINWNVVPMWWGDNPPYTLFTEMEWIGKLAYQYNYMDTRVSTLETDVGNIQDTLSNHTTRIVNLETITDALPTTYLTIADALSTYLSKNDAMEKYVSMSDYSDLWLDYNRFKNSVNTDTAVYFESLNALNDYTTTISSSYIDISSITLKSGFDFVSIQAIDHINGYKLDITIPITDITTTRTISTIKANSNAESDIVTMVVTLTNSNSLTIRVYNPAPVTTGIYGSDEPEIDYINLIYYKEGTYDPTTDDKQTLYQRADTNGDNRVDTSDSAIINSFYVDHQSHPDLYPQSDAGFTAWYNTKYSSTGDKLLPDINGDGVADTSDSAIINKYYTYIQGSGEENNYTTFWNFING